MKRFALCLVASIFIVMLFSNCLGAYAVNVGTKYTFGVPDPDNLKYTLPDNKLPKLETQNVDNFYFYYSLQYDVDGNVDLTKIKECVYDNVSGAYGFGYPVMEPQADDINNYINGVKAADPNANAQCWWRIISDGTAMPAGNMSTVIYFKAPEAGTYTIDAEISGGSKGGDEWGADGVVFAIYDKSNSTRLYKKDTGPNMIAFDAPTKALTNKSVTLAKDDKLYFVVDPKATFPHDQAHWYIDITYKEAPPTEAPASSEVSSESSSELSSESVSSSEPESLSDVSSEASSQSASAAEPANTGNAPFVFIVIGIAVVLIGGVAVYYFVFVKGKKAA